MVGNLLSNAYEAAIKSCEKKIKVQMYMQNDGAFSVIKIANSFNGKILSENDEIKSTKENEEVHGYGIKSADKVAKKYNGWIGNQWENNKFTTLLVLGNSLFQL
jgi:sensor histidine kinase regulating citrate/malate metabolism